MPSSGAELQARNQDDAPRSLEDVELLVRALEDDALLAAREPADLRWFDARAFDEAELEARLARLVLVPWDEWDRHALADVRKPALAPDSRGAACTDDAPDAPVAYRSSGIGPILCVSRQRAPARGWSNKFVDGIVVGRCAACCPRRARGLDRR